MSVLHWKCSVSHNSRLTGFLTTPELAENFARLHCAYVSVSSAAVASSVNTLTDDEASFRPHSKDCAHCSEIFFFFLAREEWGGEVAGYILILGLNRQLLHLESSACSRSATPDCCSKWAGELQNR